VADEVFRYHRRVQFAETDQAGIVHFTAYFRYMEEAEHALWRAAGMKITETPEEIGWPRVAAAFDYRSPLRFEDEIEVVVRLAALTRRTIQYGFTVLRGDVLIGTGTLTAVCVRKRTGEPMKSVDLPAEVVSRLRTAMAGVRS
jgi:YbgC/YbaW family acyl-CoA thioester hydrolase